MADPTQNIQLEGGTYEIIRNRLLKQGRELRGRLNDLNSARKEVFGSIENKLLATDRIPTENNCIAQDIVAIGDRVLFGYNVHMGLKTETRLSDVFAVYTFDEAENRFHEDELTFITSDKFEEDFKNLYKYYRHTVFARFAKIGVNLYLVFQIGKSHKDIKAFKFTITPDQQLAYVDARSETEVKKPAQHEFKWQRAHRDMQREGKFPHISIEDRLFVETMGGSLTIKVEDNTDTGLGIYSEEVNQREQTLDDAEFFYADLGNIILLKVRPFQEKAFRYFAYNEKIQEARRIDTLADSCVLLPDDHGIIFSNGYYLQTGEFKLFETGLTDLDFEKRIQSPNGEDYLFVFFNPHTGTYVLLSYNLIAQAVDTPIVCNGFAQFESGKLTYFKSEEDPRKHHAIQIWQSPYVGPNYSFSIADDNYLFKIGNKDIVRAMAECTEVLTLLNKDDSYSGLYVDLVKLTGDVLDSYYWISHGEAFKLSEPLTEIRQSAEGAIEEFEKVVRIRKHTKTEMGRVKGASESLVKEADRTLFENVNQFVNFLAQLRQMRGEVISLKELRYVDLGLVEELEEKLAGQTERLSRNCVEFLLREDSLTPYEESVEAVKKEIEGVKTAVEGQQVEENIESVAAQLELLIEIVSNLKIEDATQTTQIIDHISDIYAELNQVRSALRRKRKELMSSEAVAEFAAQIKLLGQAIVNYLDVSDTPEKCDEYLTKLMVQVEELEGKFAEFDEFIEQLAEKREEIYNAFEGRKLQLVEARNKRASALFRSAERILTGIRNRVKQFEEVNDINGYFASDLMIDKVRDIVAQLMDLEDNVKAEDLQSRLKTIREDAIRQLKDRKELFVDGQNIIKFGRHQFSVNVQPLDLTIVPRDDQQYFHLSGTNFFEAIQNDDFEATRPIWQQELISENGEVYRAEYLAYRYFQELVANRDALLAFSQQSPEDQLATIRQFMAPRYQEGYAKGVHDHDAQQIVSRLVDIHQHIELLRYEPSVRACALLWWEGFATAEEKELFDHRLTGASYILKVFPETEEFGDLEADLSEAIRVFQETTGLFSEVSQCKSAEYLFAERTHHERFVGSDPALKLLREFDAYLRLKSTASTFDDSLKRLNGAPTDRFELISAWLGAFAVHSEVPDAREYVPEAAAILFVGGVDKVRVGSVDFRAELEQMNGDHPVIGQDRKYVLHYLHFFRKLHTFESTQVRHFNHYTHLKHQLTEDFRDELRLNEFKPRVLSSFVRNRLIDEVYLPLFGDNLAKQMGTVGENKRTDRMGMLLLISPPGYGKTTLMEYIANRLGLIFMKINGPAIGHSVTALDPEEAPNAAAREELNKLNLALEMGDNIMLYLDDIQHCHPEFLQKFISLCDAQRKIEGVYKGRPRTYDLRGKRVCVVMAGNPYTESGTKFQVPDMLANRADTYNLGDIIGETDEYFKLSLIENCLTSNTVLQKVAQRSHKDIHAFLQIAETDQREGVDFEGNYTPEDVTEIVAVLKKLVQVRDVVLQVNQQYILSAGMADDFRTEPSFKLQGSYRDMNKLAEKILPIMNDAELKSMLMGHYESESQTLTTGAEANLLKFKEMANWMTEEESARWNDIKATFMKKQRLLGIDGTDKFGQVIAQLGSLVDGIEGMRKALEEG